MARSKDWADVVLGRWLLAPLSDQIFGFGVAGEWQLRRIEPPPSTRLHVRLALADEVIDVRLHHRIGSPLGVLLDADIEIAGQEVDVARVIVEQLVDD